MNKFLFCGLIQLIALISLVHAQCYDDETGFFPDDSQCDKYIECNNGKLVNVSLCDDGLVFVQQSKLATRAICQLPFHVDCGNRNKLQEPQPSNHCPRKNGYFKHETDCFRFWQCVNGKAFLNECPHSLAFNEINGNCDWSSTCLTSSKTSQPDGLNNEFVCPQEPQDTDFGNYPEPRYPHNTDCKTFYICLLDPSGKRSARLNACSYGLVFNAVTKNCEEPSKVPECAKTYNEDLDEDPEERSRHLAKLKQQRPNN